jgi:hypothetical protein
MKTALSITIVALITCPFAFGRQPQKASSPRQEAKAAEQLPSVDQILNRYVQALGGKAAIERLTSLALTGTLEVPSAGISGKAELIARAPNRFILKLEIEGIGTFTQAYDGTAGWSQDPINGLRDIGGAELAQLKREADFHREAHLKDVYSKLVVLGKEKVGASDTYVIEATPPEGGPEKLYFDTLTGLLVRTDSINRSPQGEIPAEAYIEDYKEINGVKIPVTLRQVTSVLTSTIRFADAKPNVEVEQTRFSKPGSQ